jgi:hypothetical protein
MFEKLKNLMRPAASAGAAQHIHSLSAEARRALQVDVRKLLRNVVQADEFPYLAQLGQTARSDFSSIHIPLRALPKLALEIETIRHRLPAKSPLLKLAETARRCRGMDLVVASLDEGAGAMETEAGAAARREDAALPTLTAGEQLQILRTAAAEVDVSYVSTAELGEGAQAAYYKYCLGLGEHDKIIADLRPRAAAEPRVWVWSLLVAAMRLSNHPDFSATVAEFHIWLEDRHPETLNDMTDADDRRKFNGEKVAAIEAMELAQR